RAVFAPDRATARGGVVAGLVALPDQRNDRTGTGQSRGPGAAGGVPFHGSSAMAVALCSRTPQRLAGRAARPASGPRSRLAPCRAGPAVDRRGACAEGGDLARG